MKKILVIKLASLGDVLATTPVFSSLTKRGYIVDHLVDESCQKITENNPFVHQVIIINNKAIATKTEKVIETIKIIKRIKIEKYDVVLIFHRTALLTLLSFFSGIRKIYGFKNVVSFLHSGSIEYKFSTINRTIQEFEIVKLFENSIEKPSSLEYYPSNLSSISRFALPQKYFVCNPGGGTNKFSDMASRRWPIEYFVDVIMALPFPVVIVGNGQIDLELSNIFENNIINLVNKTTLDETALILRNAMLYFGNDSSMTFLAAAMGIPTLGIYGPTQYQAANPIGDKQFFLASTLDCSPCYNPYEGVQGKAYKCLNNECLREIKPTKVLEKIKEIIKVVQDDSSSQ